MSISSALTNALSGLSVASRAADVVSTNISNAMTDGYGVRELEIASRGITTAGQGAQVVGVHRHEDIVLVSDRRRADAEVAFSRTQMTHLQRLEGLIGTPDQPTSLVARAAGFEAALTTAAAAPHDPMRLGLAVAAAVSLADTVRSISGGIQGERLQADRDIATGVGRINDALQELHTLNIRIRRDISARRDTSALLDAQARLVDQIAPLVPLESRRDQAGALQLYTADGQQLLGARPSVLAFSPAAVMAPDLTREDGTLSGLTLNGQALALEGTIPAFAGGQIAALFALRDDWGVTAQARVDAVARDLVTRFEDPALDPTRAPGQPGLFTDAGAAFDPGNELGLSRRLRVNGAVLPEQGGAHWRLRDGLGAVSEGPRGAPERLLAQVNTLSAIRPTVSGGFSATSRSFSGLVADHLSDVGLTRVHAERRQANGAARFGALRQQELAQGVDTDAELQRLLRIEQVFAANARVVTAAKDMIDQLIRIGR